MAKRIRRVPRISELTWKQAKRRKIPRQKWLWARKLSRRLIEYWALRWYEVTAYYSYPPDKAKRPQDARKLEVRWFKQIRAIKPEIFKDMHEQAHSILIDAAYGLPTENFLSIGLEKVSHEKKGWLIWDFRGYEYSQGWDTEIWRNNRIGLDLDKITAKELRAIQKKARKLGRITTYKTHRGWHVIIHRSWRSAKENLEIRQELGDDKKRMEYDRIKLKKNLVEIVDTLFDAKYFIPKKRLWIRRKV